MFKKFFDAIAAKISEVINMDVVLHTVLSGHGRAHGFQFGGGRPVGHAVGPHQRWPHKTSPNLTRRGTREEDLERGHQGDYETTSSTCEARWQSIWGAI